MSRCLDFLFYYANEMVLWGIFHRHVPLEAYSGVFLRSSGIVYAGYPDERWRITTTYGDDTGISRHTTGYGTATLQQSRPMHLIYMAYTISNDIITLITYTLS